MLNSRHEWGKNDEGMGIVSSGIVPEQVPFDVAWRTIDGPKVRYATNGGGRERVVLLSPWPESIFAFAPVFNGDSIP
jgi:hypothetical protein